MKKRILATMGLALVLALCLLAGCTGNGQTETDTDTATETDTDTATETDTETTTETDTGNGAETATATETATETATMDYFESTKIELVEPDTSLMPDMSIAGDGYDILPADRGQGVGVPLRLYLPVQPGWQYRRLLCLRRHHLRRVGLDFLPPFARRRHDMGERKGRADSHAELHGSLLQL